MHRASEQMEFEQAADYRDKIQYIEQTVERQVIMSKGYDNIDVFAYTYDIGWISIQVFMLRQGSSLNDKRLSSLALVIRSRIDDLYCTFLH